MSLLTQALQDIDYWIENSKSWHAEWIRSFGVRPGLEREMIELYSEEYDFRFSEEIYELYQWHDGDIRVGDNANP
jgi:cell wall assembly regulator SMI1